MSGRRHQQKRSRNIWTGAWTQIWQLGCTRAQTPNDDASGAAFLLIIWVIAITSNLVLADLSSLKLQVKNPCLRSDFVLDSVFGDLVLTLLDSKGGMPGYRSRENQIEDILFRLHICLGGVGVEHFVHLFECLPSCTLVSSGTSIVLRRVCATHLVSGAMNHVHRPERNENAPKKKKAPAPMFCTMGGVTRPMMKLFSQFEQVARATPFARYEDAWTSAGIDHGTGPQLQAVSIPIGRSIRQGQLTRYRRRP